MAQKIVMPKLGLIMTEGTVLEWPAKEGEPIKERQVVLVIEGDEGNVDKTFDLIKSIKGEKTVPAPEIIRSSGATFNWGAKAIQEAAARR